MGRRANNPNCDLLIDLVRASLLGEELPPIPQGCTPQETGTLIRRQQLTSLVYLTVAKEPKLEPLRRLLEKDYLVEIPKITNQDHEISAWLDAAEAAGLDCIPLKGFLLRKLYPSPMMRSMTDLDVLMRNMDRPAVKTWMEDMGYEAEDTHELSHHDNFIKKPWMYMELHSHLMKPRPGRDELEQKVWAHATPMPGRKHIYQMSAEDFYIFHMLHLHKHFISRGVGLKSVIDIFVFNRHYGTSLDRAYLSRELAFLKIDEFTAYMERLSRMLLGDEPADEDLKLVADYMADCGSFGSNKHYHAIRLAQTQGKTEGSKKFKYRLKLLFPGVQDMRKHFPSVQRFPFLLPFYWVARFFKSLFKGKKRHSAQLNDISTESFDAIRHVFAVTGAEK